MHSDSKDALTSECWTKVLNQLLIGWFIQKSSAYVVVVVAVCRRVVEISTTEAQSLEFCSLIQMGVQTPPLLRGFVRGHIQLPHWGEILGVGEIMYW